MAVAVLSVIIMLVAVGAIATWPVVIRRWRSGQELVPYEPRPAVPWGGVEVLLIIVCYFVIQAAIVSWFVTDHEQLLHLLWGVTTSNLVTAVAVLLITAVRGAGIADLGLSLDQWQSDIKLGAVGFALVAPLVYAIQAVLTQWFEGKHPVVELLQTMRDPTALVGVGLSVVVVAPVVEELLFRVVLQGWFEKVLSASWQEVAATRAEVDGVVLAEIAEPRGSKRLPIVISAVIFAAMHWRADSADPVPLFFLALVLGYLYQQTHRIWPSIVLHALLNGTSLLALLASPQPS
ncbi:MAG: CPBP family intramembrane metalloprotease [Planctomycetaceae bacterium]|nr:CPBP family intramembrane metalloprotease [Planctomycetaceae bacterium]